MQTEASCEQVLCDMKTGRGKVSKSPRKGSLGRWACTAYPTKNSRPAICLLRGTIHYADSCISCRVLRSFPGMNIVAQVMLPLRGEAWLVTLRFSRLLSHAGLFNGETRSCSNNFAGPGDFVFHLDHLVVMLKLPKVFSMGMETLVIVGLLVDSIFRVRLGLNIRLD